MADQPQAGADLRRANAAAVLRSLRFEGPASRAELAARTGLAKATVGTIAGTLEQAGVLREHEQVRSGDRGRPGVRLTLAGGRPVSVGFEANVEYVAAVVVDLAGETRLRLTRPVPEVARVEAVLASVAEETVALLADEDLRPVGAAVAVPGLIEGDDRTVAWTPNLRLTGTSLAEQVDAAFGWNGRVAVSNDADCAAVAERFHGAGSGADHMLYLTGTVGIGAGLVVDGRLVRGARGFAGEVGHLPLGEPDARCGCGRTGCWEATIGLHAMLDAVGLPELATPESTARAVADRAGEDAVRREALSGIGTHLGRGLAVLTGVLDPGVIVLGGYFPPLDELVLTPARAALDATLASPVQDRPELRAGLLGTESAALGAAERALGQVYDGSIDLGVTLPVLNPPAVSPRR